MRENTAHERTLDMREQNMREQNMREQNIREQNMRDNTGKEWPLSDKTRPRDEVLVNEDEVTEVLY